jgi:hypothetical protein
MATIRASTPTLVKVGAMATVRMMSPATSSSSPSRMPRPIDCRSARYEVSNGTSRVQPAGEGHGGDADGDDDDRDARGVDRQPDHFDGVADVHG